MVKYMKSTHGVSLKHNVITLYTFILTIIREELAWGVTSIPMSSGVVVQSFPPPLGRPGEVGGREGAD